MTSDQLLGSYEGRKVLVTGGAGFIGSHLVDGLVGLGADVSVIDNLSTGLMANLSASATAIDFVHSSLSDAAKLQAVVGKCDLVFHLAANASVPGSAERPDLDFEDNARGTFNVLEAVRQRGGGRIVYASSAAVYGEPEMGPMDEVHPLRPRSPYGGSKLAGEVLGEVFSRCYGLDLRRARIFNTYGPRQRRYVMFDLLEKIRRDPRKLEVLGDGDQERDYCYATDTVDALLLIGVHSDAANTVFNVTGGKPTRVRDLVQQLIQTVGIASPSVTFTLQSWRGDINRLIGDPARLRTIGWRPKVDLDLGLRRLVEWHRAEFKPPW